MSSNTLTVRTLPNHDSGSSGHSFGNGGSTLSSNAPNASTGNRGGSSPTMGELGLLLSGLALAGAAAPALRRREKQGKKG